MILFIVILILYNPLIPVELSREIWTPINFMTSGVYIWALIRVKNAIMKLDPIAIAIWCPDSFLTGRSKLRLDMEKKYLTR